MKRPVQVRHLEPHEGGCRHLREGRPFSQASGTNSRRTTINCGPEEVQAKNRDGRDWHMRELRSTN